MKKLFIILFAFAILAATSVKGQELITKQIAFATKTADSLIGGAPAGGTTKYFYFNTVGNATTGFRSKATQPITNYEIYAIAVQISLPTKAADVVDSTQISFEVSIDNTNWYKWTCAGATTAATQTQYDQGGPKVSGSGTYRYVPLASPLDLVSTTNAAGGAIFMPKGCMYPYSRVKITAFKASASAYPAVYYTLKKIN